MAKLTTKQRRFVEEYSVDHNATQAAIRAGYSPRTARAIGAQNLQKLDIRKAVQAELAANAERCSITVERITDELEEARLLAFSEGRS